MRATLALLVLAACGSPTASLRSGPARARTKAPDPWVALDPHGDDWEAKVATIAEDQREAMAIALLREGNFNCETIKLQEGCESVTRFLGVRPTDDLESPCLRRRLARWAVDQIPGEILATDLHERSIALIASGGLDPDLSLVVFEKLLPAANEAVRVSAITAMERIREDLADASITGLSNESLFRLACEDVDAAALALVESDAANSREHRDCPRDTRFRRETSVKLVEHERDSGESYRYFPFKGIEWDDCTILSLVEKEHGSPRGGGWPRQMCIGLSHQEDIRDLIAPGALTVRHDTDDVNDDRNDRRYTEHVENDDDFELPFAEELLLAFPDCRRDDSCQVPGTQVVFKFTYDEMNRLTEIERDETIGGCD